MTPNKLVFKAMELADEMAELYGLEDALGERGCPHNGKSVDDQIKDAQNEFKSTRERLVVFLTESITERHLQLMHCIREARRLNNLVVRDYNEMNCLHQEMDRFLASAPELDDPNERFDAPHRVEHRGFVDSLFQPRRR